MPPLTPGHISGGIFISLEGGDGTGKSTQFDLLVRALAGAGWPVEHAREPGGTPLSEEIRGLLLDPGYKDMTPATEAMLFAASRAQLVHTVVRPALREGKIVILDRYVDSSLVYQGVALGLLDFVTRINEMATGGQRTDLTILFDLDPAGAGRTDRGAGDRIERRGSAYHEIVRRAFLDLAGRSGGRVVVVDAARPIDVVHEDVMRLALAALAGANDCRGGGRQ
jgi:dTMP kinase